MLPIDRLDQIVSRFQFLEAKLNDELSGEDIAKISREYAELRPVVDEINQYIKNAASSELKGVLDFTDRELVSTDFNHHPASSIAHLDQTRVMPDGMTRIFSWYDNEWGFSNRMLDTASCMG